MPRARSEHAENHLLVEVTDNPNAPELRPMNMLAVDTQAELANGDFAYIEIRYKKALQRTFRRYWNYGKAARLIPLNHN